MAKKKKKKKGNITTALKFLSNLERVIEEITTMNEIRY
jgi:hypothetical protein